MKLYYDTSKGEVAPTLIPGEPPVDQSVLVAQLQAQVASLTAQVAALTKARDDRQAVIDAVKADISGF